MSGGNNVPERTPGQNERWLLGGLDPSDALSEVICGLVMTLTIMLTAGYYVEGSANPSRTLCYSAVGCTFAWGIIDGLLYVMTDFYARARRNKLLRTLRTKPLEGRAEVQRRASDHFAELLTAAQLGYLVDALVQAGKRLEMEPARFTRENFRALSTSVICNIAALIPATLPFLLLPYEDWKIELRVSNALLVAVLFGVGFAWAKAAGFPPWRVGFFLLAIGLSMVGVAVLLGG